jgi:hypothetical protein
VLVRVQDKKTVYFVQNIKMWFWVIVLVRARARSCVLTVKISCMHENVVFALWTGAGSCALVRADCKKFVQNMKNVVFAHWNVVFAYWTLAGSCALVRADCKNFVQNMKMWFLLIELVRARACSMQKTKFSKMKM